MFCNACGQDNPPSARFCGHCGKSLDLVPSVQAQPNIVGSPEPFGFRSGMSKEEVLSLVPPECVLKDEGDSLQLSTAPKPHDDFQIYVVSVSPSTGLCQVVGLSKDITTNVYGEAIKDKFSELKAALSKRYGNPANTYDFLREGSIWTEAREWTMALLKEERTLNAFWRLPRNANFNVEAKASSQESCFLVLRFQFENFHSWLVEHNERKDRVF
jgi:hypothetical protein